MLLLFSLCAVIIAVVSGVIFVAMAKFCLHFLGN